MDAGFRIPSLSPRRCALATRRWATAFVLAAGAIVGIARPVHAADPAPAPIVVRDDHGTEHRLERPVQRLVTLLPSLTESAWVLGAGSRLVGVDRHSNWPAEIAALPRLGGLDDARIESIVALRPDAVLATGSTRGLDRLEALGVRVVRLRTDRQADLQRSLQLIAALLGDPSRAAAEWARIDQALEAAAAQVPAAARGQRVYFEVGDGPYAAGPDSFIGQTLARLHLLNTVPATLGPFPKLNPEFVVRSAPDLILGSARGLADLDRRPGWGSLAAVRQARVCRYPPAEADVLVRPGPRLGEAAALIVQCLQRLDREGRFAPARAGGVGR